MPIYRKQKWQLNNKKKKKMATINFGGVNEHVVTREEFPLEKAVKTLKNMWRLRSA